MRLTSAVAGALIAAGLMAPASAADGSTEWTIRMTGQPDFVPDQVIVEEGETVRWVNESDETFTVTADPSKAPNMNFVRVPPEGEPFDSGPLAPGESFEHTFPAPGTFVYFSAPHVDREIIGTVTVERLDERAEPHQYGDDE